MSRELRVGNGVLEVIGLWATWGRRDRKVDFPVEGEPRRRISTCFDGTDFGFGVDGLVVLLLKDGVVRGV